MATFVHGIAASENIDSSGERISIAGMDISSLAIDGTLTFEHEAATGPKGEKITIKMPEQTVGKVLKAKKIFSEKDCEDDHELYFWNKCKTPYIYALGELFDDYTDAARDLAGKLRYDADHKHQNERTVINFSIEGAYIAKEGIDVTRSVARKITLTSLPCNKAAIAEMVPTPGSAKGKNDIDSLFKTETIEIELFKTEPLIFVHKAESLDLQKHADALGIEPMQKNVLSFKKPLAGGSASPAAAAKLPEPSTLAGTRLGSTKSGKAVMSHAKIHEYHGFSSQDHNDAANMHHKAATGARDPKTGSHHLDKMKLHLQATKTAEQKEGRFDRAKAAISAKSVSRHQNPSLFEKSMEAGSGMAAPGNLVGGAALAKEDLDKKMKKSEWLDRAEEEYSKWDKREDFQAFLAARLPNLTKGEIDAIGQTLALKKSLDKENFLAKLVNIKKASLWKCSTNKHSEEELCKKERCWSGYEPTPGKKPFSKGSCRKA